MNIFGEVVDRDLSLEDEEIKMPLDKKGREFNIFSLTDAIGARDRRGAWIIYQRALSQGVAPEEIFWKIVWQVKSLLLASKTESAEEAGMKTYPYSKAKGYLKNFEVGELLSLSEGLVLGYHDVRRGQGDMETCIEKTILSL